MLFGTDMHSFMLARSVEMHQVAADWPSVPYGSIVHNEGASLSSFLGMRGDVQVRLPLLEACSQPCLTNTFQHFSHVLVLDLFLSSCNNILKESLLQRHHIMFIVAAKKLCLDGKDAVAKP